jgi:hypothetical protein
MIILNPHPEANGKISPEQDHEPGKIMITIINRGVIIQYIDHADSNESGQESRKIALITNLLIQMNPQRVKPSVFGG